MRTRSDWADPLYEGLGRRIQEARRAKGISQRDLAEVLGYRRTSIVNVEAGRQRPPVHIVIAVADLLEVRVGDLLGRA